MLTLASLQELSLLPERRQGTRDVAMHSTPGHFLGDRHLAPGGRDAPPPPQPEELEVGLLDRKEAVLFFPAGGGCRGVQGQVLGGRVLAVEGFQSLSDRPQAEEDGGHPHEEVAAASTETHSRHSATKDYM